MKMMWQSVTAIIRKMQLISFVFESVDSFWQNNMVMQGIPHISNTFGKAMTVARRWDMWFIKSSAITTSLIGWEKSKKKESTWVHILLLVIL